MRRDYSIVVVLRAHFESQQRGAVSSERRF